MKYERINPNKKQLTTKRIRKQKGFEKLTEKQANELLDNINLICQFIYSYYRSNKGGNHHVE